MQLQDMPNSHDARAARPASDGRGRGQDAPSQGKDGIDGRVVEKQALARLTRCYFKGWRKTGQGRHLSLVDVWLFYIMRFGRPADEK